MLISETGKKHIATTLSIIKMIVMDLQPYSMVEDVGFRMLMKTVVPLYKVPSAKTITRKISKNYEQELVVYKKLLKN